MTSSSNPVAPPDEWAKQFIIELYFASKRVKLCFYAIEAAVHGVKPTVYGFKPAVHGVKPCIHALLHRGQLAVDALFHSEQQVLNLVEQLFIIHFAFQRISRAVR